MIRQPEEERMKDIKVTMSRAAYSYYMKSRKEGGGGIKNKQELIEYLNKTGGFRGNVTDIIVEADALRKPRAKDDE